MHDIPRDLYTQLRAIWKDEHESGKTKLPFERWADSKMRAYEAAKCEGR